MMKDSYFFVFSLPFFGKTKKTQTPSCTETKTNHYLVYTYVKEKNYQERNLRDPQVTFS